MENKAEYKKIIDFGQDAVEAAFNIERSIEDLMLNIVAEYINLNNQEKISIQALADADLVVFQDNWGDYAGCSVEHKICEEYNIPRLYMEDLEED